VKFFFFHLMPWPHVSQESIEEHGSAWIWYPNSFWDAEEGNRLYNRYLDELEYAETVGFDGVCVNEHHQNAYGTMPSPNLFAATLARRTERVKIAVIGNALPLYNPPLRVAEEYAILDVISGGRLIAGFVVGGAPEYFSFRINPVEARDRFREAHDLIVKAWTQDGPFEFNGKFYRYQWVNPWPKPMQKPHPPIWVPGIGSLETMEFVAKHHYSYMGIPYFHIRVFERNFAAFRDACEKEGYTPDPEQMGWLVPVYVAESDARAREEYEEHLWYFAKRLLKGIDITPPGYTSPKSILRILQAKGDFMLDAKSWEDIEAGAYAIVGSPETVREKLAHYIEKLGVGNLLTLLQLGSMPADLTRKNTDLFAAEVMPYLRKEFGNGNGI
jgi:alkanesulfonate monooxygenase SsuD/methylene tetrahydromethanopterin reductase-like flavin-dependent oxidoreductase (luciferase family)